MSPAEIHIIKEEKMSVYVLTLVTACLWVKSDKPLQWSANSNKIGLIVDFTFSSGAFTYGTAPRHDSAGRPFVRAGGGDARYRSELIINKVWKLGTIRSSQAGLILL